MNSPKEKAEELVEKFSIVGLQQRNEGIACALIAVDEILKSHEMSLFCENIVLDYWYEVQDEINKL